MTNKVEKRQLGFLVFFVPIIFKVAMLPSMLTKEMGNDAWLGILTMLILEFIQLYFIVGVVKEGGILALKEKIGKGWYLLLTVPLLLVFGVKTIVYVAEGINYVSTFLFYNTQKINVTILLMIAIGYLAVAGVNTMGRLSEILVWALPTILLVGLSFGEVRLKPEYVAPVLTNGYLPVLKGIGKYMMWTFDLTPLLFCNMIDKHPKRPLLPIAAVVCTVAITVFYLLFIMNYGGSAEYIEHAFAALAAFNVVNTEIGSIDWPTITIWMGMMLIALGLKAYGAGRIGEGFGVPYRIGTSIFVAIATILCLFVFHNLEKGIALGISAMKYIVIAIDCLVPVVAFTILKAMKAKGQRKEGGAA